jgi:galactokinase
MPLDTASTWSAPGRVNLMGEHTDYNDGLVLPIALPQRTHARASLRDDGILVVSSASAPGVVRVPVAQIGPGTPAGWASYVAGVVWALRGAGHDVPGLTVHITSEVPVGAGLSSSAALECSVAAALSDLLGLGLLADDTGRAELGRLCQLAENEIAQAPTGGMDQAIAMRGLAGHALFLDCRDGSARQVPFDPEAHGLRLLVVDTRAKHALVDGQYAARRDACVEAARTLGVPSLRDAEMVDIDARLTGSARRRARHVVTEIERVRQCVEALGRGDFARVGAAFVASHESLRDDFEVSCVELDTVVEVALGAGAWGARMTGGGFGGSAIALLPAPSADSVVAAVTEAFGRRGFDTPSVFFVTPGGSAGVDAAEGA